MSYMLEFPASPLPKNILSPPYVLFGINDIDAFSELPTNIPLALILYFAPSLHKWVLPTPELSASAARLALRTPYVGVNIIADIEIEGLRWILARMMQIANVKLPPGQYGAYMVSPNLLVSISIHKAWKALELPPKGIDPLYTHIQTMLMLGAPVTLLEMKGLWHNFTVKSPILHEMALNFIRNYIDRLYTTHESSAARHWYLETTERWNFFRAFEKQFPAFDDVQKDVIKETSQRHKREELHLKMMANAEANRKLSVRNVRVGETQSKQAYADIAEREKRASRRRHERANSVDSASSTSSTKTVIWNPLEEKQLSPKIGDDTVTPTTRADKESTNLAQPVDSSALVELLKVMANDRRAQEEANGVKKMYIPKTKARKAPEGGLCRKGFGSQAGDLSGKSRFDKKTISREEKLPDVTTVMTEEQFRSYLKLQGMLHEDDKAAKVESSKKEIKENKAGNTIEAPKMIEKKVSYCDEEEDTDEMEYIAPETARKMAELKFEHKHNIPNIPKGDMDISRTIEVPRKRNGFPEKAPATTPAEVPDLKSGTEVFQEVDSDGIKRIDFAYNRAEKPALKSKTLVLRNALKTAFMGRGNAAVGREKPAYEQTMDEKVRANGTSSDDTTGRVKEDSRDETKKVDGALLENSDGLMLLRPTVYKAPR